MTLQLLRFALALSAAPAPASAGAPAGLLDGTSPPLVGGALAQLTGKAVLAAAPPNVLRVEVVGQRSRLAADCTAAEASILGPIVGSGRLTLRLAGSDRQGRACQGWSWVEVRLFARAFAPAQAIDMGQPIADRLVPSVVEWLPGHHLLTALPGEAVAAAPLAAGAPLEVQAVRSPAQIPGRELAVRLRAGDLVVETRGRAVPCALDAACARLETGKQVSGTYLDGVLEVALP